MAYNEPHFFTAVGAWHAFLFASRSSQLAPRVTRPFYFTPKSNSNRSDCMRRRWHSNLGSNKLNTISSGGFPELPSLGIL
uniref:Uncharacterized protein n=1 Tax=Timema poppense TaxID=170557 RepID=A0A7R9DGX4_TIMPO|nr:unnamed protein product [Timema poppensis]